MHGNTALSLEIIGFYRLKSRAKVPFRKQRKLISDERDAQSRTVTFSSFTAARR